MADRKARTGRMPLAQTGLYVASAIFLGTVGGTAGWLALTGDDGTAMATAATDHAPSGQDDGQGTGHDAAPAHGGSDDHGKAPAAAPGHTPAPAATLGDDHGQAAPAPAHADAGHATGGHDAPAKADASDHEPAHGAATSHGDGQSSDGHGTADSHAPDHETPVHETPAHETPAREAPDHAPGQELAMAPAALPGVPAAPKPPPVVVSPNRKPLVPAPDPAITSKGRYGPLPIRSTDGRLPWQVYARPFEAAVGTPRIAIVIANMGLAEQPTLAAIQDLPGEVTLAFSPYSSRLAEWVPAARAAGHEVLLQLPMEPRSTEFNDPGNKALLTANSPELNLDRMEWVLSRAEGYVGLTNLMGSRFTVSPKDMQPVLAAMDQRGLLYIDSRESPASIAGKLALEMGLPAATNDRFIDAEAARGPIDSRLAQLEQLALARGSAVGFAADYPVAIERLRFWISGLNSRGFVLAPVSAVVRTAPPE